MKLCRIYPLVAVFIVLTYSGLLFAQSPSGTLYVPKQEQIDAYRRSPSDHVRAAVELKTKVDEQNRIEIAYLLKEVNDRKAKFDQKKVQSRVDERLKSEKAKLVELKRILDEQKGNLRGSPSLRTSLVKLIGTDTLTGILDDAAQMLSVRADEIFNSNLTFIPTHNQITVLKTLLIYVLLAIRDEPNLLRASDMAKSLELIYPAFLPKVEFKISLDEISLYSKDDQGNDLIYVPNAGFIFGGDFVNDVCRGIDCSAFLSKTTKSSKRLSTMVMEYTWRSVRNESFEKDDSEGKIREDFKLNWGLKEAVEEYQAVEPKVEKVQPGDLIVWRWTPTNAKARTGHVVMFVDWIDRSMGEFVGIEVNREDDKSLEGFVFRNLKLVKENADTYILRRK